MTHSYLVRAWALEHIHRGVLGRGAIADACLVAPKTVTSWARAESGRAPSLLATHREYTRALAILLYERFPQHHKQVAAMLGITPRMILEWRMQVRSTLYQSELIWATRLALVCLHDRIPTHLRIKNNEISLTQNKYPDSSELENLVFAVYDAILQRNLNNAGYAQYRRGASSFEKFLTRMGIPTAQDEMTTPSIPQHRRINGAHSYRGAVIHADGSIDLEPFYQDRRRLYSEVPSKLTWLSRSELIRTADEPLEEILCRLTSPAMRNKKYQMLYGRRKVKWSRHQALMNYIVTVDPQYSAIKNLRKERKST